MKYKFIISYLIHFLFFFTESAEYAQLKEHFDRIDADITRNTEGVWCFVWRLCILSCFLWLSMMLCELLIKKVYLGDGPSTIVCGIVCIAST